MLFAIINTADTAPVFSDGAHNTVANFAAAQGYTAAEIRAGLAFFDRKTRRTNPPGEFDKQGRFYADERTEAVQSVRSPSKAWPMSEMLAARTAAHCAELFDAEELLAVKRVAKAREALDDAADVIESAHEKLASIAINTATLRRILKPIKR